MSEPTTLLCPGQGAQSVGMGKAWFDASPAAAQTFAAADEALGFSISELCFDGPADRLNRTDIAQCAIYTASVACFQALLDTGKLDSFATTAGLSLGEFTALHLAGAYDFVEGLQLVRLRGQAMQDAADASQGSMVAVTGDVSEAAIEELCAKVRGDLPESVLVPANYNSPMQVVVSGTLDACERAVGVAGEMGFKPTPLTVAGAFHSPLMQPAADRLAAALDNVQWSSLNARVISNVTAEPHDNDPAAIKANLVAQLTSPVRWTQSMQWAVANLGESTRYIELAPGKVLSGLMRRIDRGTKVENFDKP